MPPFQLFHAFLIHIFLFYSVKTLITVVFGHQFTPYIKIRIKSDAVYKVNERTKL